MANKMHLNTNSSKTGTEFLAMCYVDVKGEACGGYKYEEFNWKTLSLKLIWFKRSDCQCYCLWLPHSTSFKLFPAKIVLLPTITESLLGNEYLTLYQLQVATNPRNFG